MDGDASLTGPSTPSGAPDDTATSRRRLASKWDSEGSDDDRDEVSVKKKKKAKTSIVKDSIEGTPSTEQQFAQVDHDAAAQSVIDSDDQPNEQYGRMADDGIEYNEHSESNAPSASPIPSKPRYRTAFDGPILASCRSVDNYEKLNRIEEGSYGVVYRARDRKTGEVVALKKLKLENEKNGFPVTTLREIHTLLLAKHRHIVDVREIVVTPSYAGYDHFEL
jgi:cell division cycle 2-like protein